MIFTTFLFDAVSASSLMEIMGEKVLDYYTAIDKGVTILRMHSDLGWNSIPNQTITVNDDGVANVVDHLGRTFEMRFYVKRPLMMEDIE